jgi:hypothetical protein
MNNNLSLISMRRIKGSYYTNSLNSFKNSDGFFVCLERNTLLEVQIRDNHLEFALSSDAQTIDVFRYWINIFADGLGFLLGFPIQSIYLPTLEEITVLPSRDTIDTQVVFNIIENTFEYSQAASHYVEAEIPKKIVLSTSEIKNFIAKIRTNESLKEAIGYYLKGLDEPEFFLVLFYKAYELIKNTGSTSKTEAKKFTRLANDVNVFGSRHTSKQASELRLPYHDEWIFCQEFIRKGIFRFAHNLQ